MKALIQDREVEIEELRKKVKVATQQSLGMGGASLNSNGNYGSTERRRSRNTMSQFASNRSDQVKTVPCISEKTKETSESQFMVDCSQAIQCANCGDFITTDTFYAHIT